MEEWSVYTSVWFYHSACFQDPSMWLRLSTVSFLSLLSSMHHNILIHSLGHLVCFQLGAISICVQVFVYICFYFSSIDTQEWNHQDRVGVCSTLGFPGGTVGKESACNAGDMASIPVSGRSPGGGHGIPLQDSCLEKSMNRGVQWLYSPQGHRVRHH